MEKKEAVPGKNGIDLFGDKSIITTTDLKNKDDFCISLFKGLRGYIEIREINGKAKSQFLTYSDLLEYYPKHDKNIYIGMFTRKNNRSGKAENCLESRVLWADFDNETLENIKEITKELKPNIIVNSGHGYHTYWLLDKAHKPEDLRPTLKAIAEALGSDSRTAETARVMRLPGTYNIKADPVKCELISIEGKPYSLETIKKHYPANTKEQTPPVSGLIPGEQRQCILNILNGVPAGSRNWLTGRLTKELQVRGYTKGRAFEIVTAWNKKNDPPEAQDTLYKSFIAYWAGDYKLLGCKMPNKDQQATLSLYCDPSKCRYSGQFEVILDNAVKINNRVFSYYKKLSGYDLVLYAVLLSEKQGLSTPQIIQELTLKRSTPFMDRKTLYKSLEKLRKLDLIEVTQKQGRATFAKAINKGNYGTGYTILNYGATIGAINSNILPGEYKLYIHLLKYAFGKGEAYPSEETLANAWGVTKAYISNKIKGLRKAGYIKVDHVYKSNGFYKLLFRLKV
jgi:biotin operon repressor